jgi:hypothetical protein
MSAHANNPDELTPKQEEGIIALLNCPSVRKAADQIGVHEKTIYRWLDEEPFMRAYRRARRKAFNQAIGLTQQYAPMAVANLTRIANDPSAPHAARVSACTALLKFSRESIELDDVMERVEGLERRVSEAGTHLSGGTSR